MESVVLRAVLRSDLCRGEVVRHGAGSPLWSGQASFKPLDVETSPLIESSLPCAWNLLNFFVNRACQAKWPH